MKENEKFISVESLSDGFYKEGIIDAGIEQQKKNNDLKNHREGLLSISANICSHGNEKKECPYCLK